MGRIQTYLSIAASSMHRISAILPSLPGRGKALCGGSWIELLLPLVDAGSPIRCFCDLSAALWPILAIRAVRRLVCTEYCSHPSASSLCKHLTCPHPHFPLCMRSTTPQTGATSLRSTRSCRLPLRRSWWWSPSERAVGCTLAASTHSSSTPFLGPGAADGAMTAAAAAAVTI